MYELKVQKNKIRTQYIDKRVLLPSELKESYDRRICSLFLSLVTYRFADIILMYAPTKNEIDVLPVARRALEQGKKIAFPVCDVKNHTMEFRIVPSLDCLSGRGSFGIPEPDLCCELYSRQSQAKNAVCLVPAIVYDTGGYRLGYGKGFYDRYLPSFLGTKVGFVYSDFIIGHVPRSRYDLAVDVLVTEKGVRALHAG